MSKLLANLTFAVKGKRLRVSAAGFTRYESEDAAKAAGTGTCQPTKAPWDEAYREARVEFDVRSRTLPD